MTCADANHQYGIVKEKLCNLSIQRYENGYTIGSICFEAVLNKFNV